MDLLHNHILSENHDPYVEVINEWPKESETDWNPHLIKRVKSYPTVGPGTRYLLFNNAQDTYWDVSLWENFFKSVVQCLHGPFFAVLFCSYGNPGERPLDYDSGTPLRLPSGACISLTPSHNDSLGLQYPPIGLFFSREEFEEAVDRYRILDRGLIHVDEDL